jgi:hypothetical protein
MTRKNHPCSRISIVGISLGILIALAVPFTSLSGHPNGQALPILITQPIDENKLVTLRGNTRPEANSKNDRGPVPDDFPMPHMLLQLRRAPQLEHDLDQYIDGLADKSSPNFRRWMTAAEQGEQYGLAQGDLDVIIGWLQSHGFTVGYVYPNRMVIDFSGTAGQIYETFHTQIHYLEVGGKLHFANFSDPQIPRALVPAVVGVVSMHNFKPHPMYKSAGKYTFAGCTTSSGAFPTEPGTCYSLVPGDFQTIYNLNPLYRIGIAGTGQTIVVVEDSDTYSNDVAIYRSTFLGKYSGTVVTTHPSGGNTCTDPGTNSADAEADIDAEVASAIAPNATIEVATCADTTTFGGLLAIENLVNSGRPPAIISMSYGECEAANGQASNAAFNSAFQTGAMAGTSVFASTGDEGAGSCAPLFFSGASTWDLAGVGVTGWGETQYNVSVGGTDFEDTYNSMKNGIPLSTYWNSTNTPPYGSAKSYIPEIPWNNSCASVLIANVASGSFTTYGSGGFCNNSIATTSDDYLTTGAGSGGPSGCATGGGGTDQTSDALVDGTCAGYPKPSYQSGIFGNPNDGVRDIPDVSLFAGNGVWGHYVTVCYSDTTNGGTSCAGAPSTWSGFGGTSIASPAMASIQALVNEKWGLAHVGNPNPTYYSIAKSEFGASGNSNCYSINQPPRHGLGTGCVFYDITQGDIDVNCRTNGQIQADCYIPSGTNGVLGSLAVTNATVAAGGTGYTAATCTIAPPQNESAYLSPTGTTLYPGATTAAACTAQFGTAATGTISFVGTPATSWVGHTVTVASTVYTFETSLTAANQVLLFTSGSTQEKKNVTAANLAAAIAGNSVSCGTVPPCFGAGTLANAIVTTPPWDNNTTNTSFTVTSRTTGTPGNFTMSSSNTTDVTVSGGANGASGTNVGLVTVNNGEAGYAGNATCTISGNGTGATCIANAQPQYAPGSYQPLFGATPGWDFATGIGTVNAYNLVFSSAWE